MTGLLLVALVFTVITLVFEPVTQLPFGLQEPLELFVTQMSIVYNLLPPIATVMNVIIIGLSVKVGMFLFRLYLQIISIIRG